MGGPPGNGPLSAGGLDKIMPEANQVNRKREDVHVTAKDLLEVPEGAITERGLRTNINVGV